jgi:hypothetical protein
VDSISSPGHRHASQIETADGTVPQEARRRTWCSLMHEQHTIRPALTDQRPRRRTGRCSNSQQDNRWTPLRLIFFLCGMVDPNLAQERRRGRRRRRRLRPAWKLSARARASAAPEPWRLVLSPESPSSSSEDGGSFQSPDAGAVTKIRHLGVDDLLTEEQRRLSDMGNLQLRAPG